MKRRNLERLVSLRQHSEREARRALAESARELTDRRNERDALVRYRDREEGELVRSGSFDSEVLQREHDHLFKIRLHLEVLENRIAELEGDVAAKEATWREARRAVRTLETLLARRDAELAVAERRRHQKLLDAFAVRSWQQGGP